MAGGCCFAVRSSSKTTDWLSGRTADLSEEVNELYKSLFCLAISLFCLEISDASFRKDSVCKRIELVFKCASLRKDSVCKRIALVFESIAEIHSASLGVVAASVNAIRKDRGKQ
jgi:hypothetical protein